MLLADVALAPELLTLPPLILARFLPLLLLLLLLLLLAVLSRFPALDAIRVLLLLRRRGRGRGRGRGRRLRQRLLVVVVRRRREAPRKFGGGGGGTDFGLEVEDALLVLGVGLEGRKARHTDHVHEVVVAALARGRVLHAEVPCAAPEAPTRRRREGNGRGGGGTGYRRRYGKGGRGW